MGNSILKRVILPFAMIVAGFAGVVATGGFLELRRPTMPDTFVDSDLNMNGSRLRGFAFGMEGLIADWYYIRALQYIGDKIVKNQDKDINLDDLRSLNPRLLYPLLDNATDLDPHFVAAYSYGAIVLPAIDKEKAIEFASKGVANNPNEWRLYQHLGYIYWRLGRYDKAAEIYEQGASIHGSSQFMKLMAATMKYEGGSRATARSIYRQMLAESDEEPVRVTAERRLKQLDWLDEREAIDEVLADFKEKNGRCVYSFGEVASMLMQVKLPDGHQFRIDSANRLVDPSDVPYLLDKEDCRVTLDAALTGLPGQNRER